MVANLAQFQDLRIRFNSHDVAELYVRWQGAGDESVQRTDVDRVSFLSCLTSTHS